MYRDKLMTRISEEFIEPDYTASIIKNISDLKEIGVHIKNNKNNVEIKFFFELVFKNVTDENIEEVIERIIENSRSYMDGTVYTEEDNDKCIIINTNNYEELKKIVHVSLMSKKMLESLDEKPIVKEYLDFYLVAKIQIDEEKSFDVPEWLIDRFGVDKETFFKDVIENTLKDMIFKVESNIKLLLNSNVIKLTEKDRKYIKKVLEEEEKMPKNDIMTVCTNTKKWNGAAGLLSTKVLDVIAKERKCDKFTFVISSKHEITIIPYSMDIDSAKEMVKSINDSIVHESIRVSDSVYRYDINTKQITIL